MQQIYFTNFDQILKMARVLKVSWSSLNCGVLMEM